MDAGGQPQAGARRLLRRLGRGGGGAAGAGRDGDRHRRLDPPARRRSPASSASSRPMGGARAGASSPSPRRWTRPGRWRARSRTARSCCGSMAGFDPKDSTSRRPAGAGFRRRLRAAACKGCGSACRASTAPTACRRRSRRSGSRAWPGCATQGAETVDVSLPHTKYGARHLLHRGAGRGLLQPRPL